MRAYQPFISLRFLRARRINYVSIAAVTFSVVVLIVVLSVMWGFDREFRKHIRGTLSPVIIEGLYDGHIDNYASIISQVMKFPHVTACSPYIADLVLVKSEGLAAYGMVRGVNLRDEAKVGDISKYFKDEDKTLDFDLDGKRPRHPGAVIGVELRKNATLAEGQTIQLISASALISGMPTFMSSNKHTVVGAFRTGMYQYDSRLIYIPLDAAQNLVGHPDQVSGISVGLDDADYANEVRDQIKAKILGRFTVQTWEQKQEHLLQAIALERRALAIVMASIVLLAGFTILATITMTVKEKTKDIGILKSIGANVGGVMGIFLFNGLFIGMIGAAAGYAISMLLLWQMNPILRLVTSLTGFEFFSRQFFYVEELPAYRDPVGIAIILVSAVVVSFLAAIYPAFKAARVDAVESLRYE